MSSVAMAATPGHANVAMVESMLTALEDRSSAWVVSASESIAVGAGGRDKREAAEYVVRVPDTDVTLAIDAMTDLRAESHEHSVTRVFPVLAETGTTADILALLDAIG